MTIAALPQRFFVGLILALSTIGAGLAVEKPTAVKGTITVPGPLVLTPTELVLVDGRKVQGQLACELEAHLILYSPNLGTLQSFRKEFVASYIRNKKVVELSAPRTLSPEELQVGLDWKGWPDAPPASGPKPAYTTQKWAPPKRLLVWRKPGVGSLSGKEAIKRDGPKDSSEVKWVGSFWKDADSWLVLGEPLVEGSKGWGAETDIILPGVDLAHAYMAEAAGDVDIAFRHAVAENHTFLRASAMEISGNVWWHERGRWWTPNVRMWNIIGAQHTFIRNDRPAEVTVRDQDLVPAVPGATWDERGRRLAQYVFVKKETGASVEFIGQFGAGDKFWMFSGATILGPDSSVGSGVQNSDHIYKDASLHLMDGAILGKQHAFPNHTTITVDGLLTAGLPERPLTRNAAIVLAKKDYTGVMGAGGNDPSGLRVNPSGHLRIYSTNPAQAKLLIRGIGSANDDMNALSLNLSPSDYDGARWKSLPTRIDVVLLGDVVLDGVIFQDLYRGGIRLKDLGMASAWKNVVFAPSCQSQKPGDNYAVYQKDVPPLGWTEDPAVKNPLISPGGKVNLPLQAKKK